MGMEIGMLGGYGFQGQVTAGDGSDKQGKMGAGCNDLRKKKKAAVQSGTLTFFVTYSDRMTAVMVVII